MGVYDRAGVKQANDTWNAYLSLKDTPPSKVSNKPTTYEDFMNAKRMLDEASATPPPPWEVTSPPIPEKEITMKPLFKFTTVRPNAATIWGTLSTHEIEPVAGLTVDQIRFMMFVVLQLETHFKLAKDLCNDYHNRTTDLHGTYRVLLNLEDESTPVTHLKVPPAGLPDWVGPELYTPYYMLKQLGDLKIELWRNLFDRTVISTEETDMHLIDLLPISKSITAYKLWYYGNDVITEKYSDIFRLYPQNDPITIHSSAELQHYLIARMHDYLREDNPIFDYTTIIAIPPFKLGVSDAPQ